jgi:hypothetical protein
VSGSTSQILAAAMRTGGSGPRRALPSAADASGVSTSSSQLSIIPSGTRPDDGNSPTHAMAIDDTQRTPEPEPRVPRRRRSWEVNQKLVIAILFAALVVALAEITYLLLR